MKRLSIGTTCLLSLLLAAASTVFGQIRDTNSHQLTTVVFANLGTPSNGVIVYCSDCTATSPTAGSGPGVFVKRENGAWNGGSAGGVSSVTGTTHQISSTGGTTPVLSFDSAVQLLSTVTDGNFGDGNSRNSHQLNCVTNSTNINTGFKDIKCVQITQTVNHGLYTPGSKTTTYGQSIYSQYYGESQAFPLRIDYFKYSMGDAGAMGISGAFWGGPRVTGDEGTAWRLATYLLQANGQVIPYNSIVSSTRSGCPSNMTVTPAITGDNSTAQTVVVSSTTGCVTGDWMIVGQVPPSSAQNMDSVQITVIDGTHISATFAYSQPSGVTLTPALVMGMSGDYTKFGEGRTLVDTDASALGYSSGTVSSVAGGQINFTGATFSNGIVGGNANNVGAITFPDDDVTAGAYSGGGGNTMKSYYQMVSVNDSCAGGASACTAIFSFTTASDVSYQGFAQNGSSYLIKPACRVMRVLSSTLVCETTPSNGSTFQVGHAVQNAVSPFNDTTGYYDIIGSFTPGGRNRAWYRVVIAGQRTFESGITFAQSMDAGGNAATAGLGVAVNISATIRDAALGVSGRVYGDVANGVDGTAIVLNSAVDDGVHRADHKLIRWNGNGHACIGSDYTNSRILLSTVCAAGGGVAVKYVSLDTSLLTASRSIQWPDKDGTVATLGDIGYPGSFVATIPATVGQATTLGSFSVTSLPYGACFRLAVAATDGVVGGGVRSYSICSMGTGSGWVILNPNSSDKDTAVDFAVDVEFQHNSTFSFRLRKTGGTNAMTAQVTLIEVAPTYFAWTNCASSCTGTVTPPTTYYASGGRDLGLTAVSVIGTTCPSSMEGFYAGVSDATSPTYLTTIAGGGSVHAPVYCDGTHWIAH